MNRHLVVLTVCAVALTASACRDDTDSAAPRATGFVEATETRVASRLGGRVERVHIREGQRVAAGDVVAELSTAEIDLTIDRAAAERAQAAAQLRLLEAGARPEDIRQGEAQLAAAEADARAARAELDAARKEEARFEQLIRNNAGAAKAHDDAVARRRLAEARVAAADDRIAAARAGLAKLRAGARPEELAAARARVAALDAQIASLEHDRREARIVAPTAALVGSRLVEPGELIAPGTPVAVLIDLDNAWANAYVEERLLGQIKLDQPATVVTDAGERVQGRISFISPRAEFTPRNVQTAEERAALVYRIKVAVDNRDGVLKPGMPVEVELTPGATR